MTIARVQIVRQGEWRLLTFLVHVAELMANAVNEQPRLRGDNHNSSINSTI